MDTKSNTKSNTVSKIRVVLYRSKVLADGRHPVVIRLTDKGRRVQYSTGHSFFPAEWNHETNEPVRSNVRIRLAIQHEMERGLDLLLDQQRRGGVDPKLWLSQMRGQTSTEFFGFSELIVRELRRSGRDGNADKYDQMISKLKPLIGPTLPMDNMDPAFLSRLESQLLTGGLSVNTVSFYFRTVRSVINKAIERGFLDPGDYPFKRFKIRRQKTKKLALTPDELRAVIMFDGTRSQNWARDMFVLSFGLIGMNPVDMYGVESVRRGVVEYTRSKTGKHYVIRIEPEIKKYLKRVGGFPLAGSGDRRTVVKTKTRLLNHHLKVVGAAIGVNGLVFGAARHSWATIARDVGVNRELIRAAFGHSAGDVLETYLAEYRPGEIWSANRSVLSTIFE